MLPKVANTILHSTSRAAAAVHGQSHTFRNVLQLQHNSTSSQQSSSSQSSSTGSGPKGPGSNFFNPNWHGTPETRDGTARGGRFTHGYLGASRAVSQAQPFVPTSDGPVQLDENQDEFELIVPTHSQKPARRFRSHSLSYSPKERAQKLGVLRTVQLHARSKHVFASPERPDHVEASVGECVRPVSPTRLVRSRSNSTASVVSPESESLVPPPPPPAQVEVSEEAKWSPWWDALMTARQSGKADEATKVVRAFRSAVLLGIDSLSSLKPTPTSSLSSPSPRSTKAQLPPGAHIPVLPEFNLALEALVATRTPGEPLTLLLQLYGDLIKLGQLYSQQGKTAEANQLKPNKRTYFSMVRALCDRDSEVVWAIENIGTRNKWRTNLGSSLTEQVYEPTDMKQLELFKAENNFRSAMALFQAYIALFDPAQVSEDSPASRPRAEVCSSLLRCCATRGVLANATIPPTSQNPKATHLFSASQRDAMTVEAITSAIHVWGSMERYGIIPDAVMYRHMLLVFSRSATGNKHSDRGWQGVLDVWEDFRSRCSEGGLIFDPKSIEENYELGEPSILVKRGLVSVWNAMIEASFNCGEPGVGIGLLEQMMRDKTDGSSQENRLDVFDQSQPPLPSSATFTTIIAGFVGLALKAIHGIPAADNVNAAQLESARNALAEYREHMGSALVWIDKLAAMPTALPQHPLDAPEPTADGPAIPRPDTLAWRAVIQALGEGYKWEMDWSERGLELPQTSSSSSSQTYSLPALNSVYDTMNRTTRAHPKDGVILRRLDTRFVFGSNWRHVYALKGRLNWAVSKGEEIEKDQLEGIQSTIRQARKDLFETLARTEALFQDIPGLAAVTDPSAAQDDQVHDLHLLDIEMVKSVYDAWRELGMTKGSWESVVDSELLLDAQKRSVSIALLFFDRFHQRMHKILAQSKGSGLPAGEQSRLETVRHLLMAFTDNFFQKVLPLTGSQPWGFKTFSELVVLWQRFNLEERMGLEMAVAFAVEFTRTLARGDDLTSVSVNKWRLILAQFAKVTVAPKKTVDELLLSMGPGSELADTLTVVQTLRQHRAHNFDPIFLPLQVKSGIVAGLSSTKSIEELETILASPPAGVESSEADANWVAMLHQTVKAVGTDAEGWLDMHNSMGRAHFSGPLPGDERAVDLVGLGGVDGGEVLSDGLSLTEESSGSGSVSAEQSTAPSSPVDMTVTRSEEMELQVVAPDQQYPVGEYFLGGQPIPSQLYIDRFHTRSLDSLLHRAVAAKDPSEMVAEIFDLFVQGVVSGRVPSPFAFARLLQLHGRCRQFEHVQFVYRVAQSMLAQMEHDKKLQSDSWFIVEDGMIIAFAQAGEVDAAHVHRMRILEHGGTPSADAYGGLILHVKDTTDDTSNAMALYQEAMMRGVQPNQYLYNNIISKLAKARKADYALELFNQMKSSGIRPSSITYGAVIGACARVGDVDSAEILFDEMVSMNNFKARVPPFNTMMQLYTTTKPNRERSLYYYDLMKKHRVHPTEYTYKLLMETYVIEPIDIPMVERVFSQLVSNRRLVVQGSHFATLINAYGCVAKDLDKAIAVFDSISTHPRGPAMDALVFEAMINVLVAHRRVDLIPDYVAKMSASGVHMTAYIMNLLIKGYAAAGDVEKARELFESLMDPPEGVAAAHNHAPHDPRLTMAIDPMAPVYREPSTWEAMIRAELGAGHRERALALLERLKARQYPEAVFNRISGILVDHSQIFS
ncbi:hypothetical protein VKT23_002731 [Stygiomarasmius scandens]|uniref:PROP1-like PPR domain-containing protein n=1 Tax=Marasmiellus scandens TaxID=2682957 RepID=A0ABR1K445_9AGAR